MIKLPDIQHLSLQRVREIAEGATPVMGEVQRLAVTALGYVEENKSAVKAFQTTGFILLEREQELEEALAEVQRLNATAQPDGNDGYVKAFYEIASILAIPAQPNSPKHVFETVMKPKLQDLVATGQTVSAPEWTNEQCLEFLSIAFRHANISGDIEMDDIRLGIRMVNAAVSEKK